MVIYNFSPVLRQPPAALFAWMGRRLRQEDKAEYVIFNLIL